MNVSNETAKIEGLFDRQLTLMIKFSDRYVTPLISLAGSFGNISAMIILKSLLKRNGKVAFKDCIYLMLVLAVIDQFVMINLLLYWLLGDLGSLNIVTKEGAKRWVCRIFTFNLRLGLLLSAWGVTFLSIERCLFVPKHDQVIRSHRTVYLCGFLLGLVVGCVLHGHGFVTFDVIQQDSGFYKCDIGITGEKRAWYYWVDYVVSSLIPCVIVIVCNICIVHFIVKKRNTVFSQKNSSLPNRQASSDAQYQNRITRVLMLVTILFVILTMPYRIMKPLSQVIKVPAAYKKLVGLSLNSFYKFLFINCAINFYCYLLSKSFRSHVRKVFRVTSH